MKAWERELDWITNAIPINGQENKEENWLSYLESGIASDKKLFKDWISFVPGSLAPCHLLVAAIQCMENKGYDVSEAEKLVDDGLKFANDKNGASLQVVSAKIYKILNEAKKNPNSKYWNYKEYKSWEEIISKVEFPKESPVNISSEEFKNKIYAGWIAQLIGGALGTQIEGYTTENIRKVFGEVNGYLRAPETYNDDITYELAFLEAFVEKGYDVTSEDIAYKWLYYIPDGYSAEEIALDNLRKGIFPPTSGNLNNYFSDWIGVQMRTMIHGMVAPGNAKLAAELSIKDGVISHSNSGILGGMFNAVMISLCFSESNIKDVIYKTIECIPKDSEYFSVLEYTMKKCNEYSSWEEVWKGAMEEYKEYHWIHCYPNIIAQIVALWYGEENFDKTANIIAMAGMDVDCTAAPVLSALAILKGKDSIPQKWIEPIGQNLYTFMREYENTTIEELCKKTYNSVLKANK